MRIIIFMALLLAGLLLWTPDLSFDRLKAFYETPQSELINTPESTLFAQDQASASDNAPTMVMIHGMGSSLQTWDEWSRILKPHFRVLRFDLPGLGLSSAPRSEDYSDGAEVKRIEQFLQSKKLEHFILVGHDLGARLAWTYAYVHPEQVSHLILLSPVALTPSSAQALQSQKNIPKDSLYDLPFYTPLIRFALPKWAVKAWLESLYADPSLITEQTLGRYRDMLLAPDVRVHLLERISQSKTLDPRVQLQAIQAPTLFLWGQEDSITSRQEMDLYQQMVPQAKAMSFKETGHVLQEESPEESARAVINFVKNPQSSEFESRSGNSTSAKPN